MRFALAIALPAIALWPWAVRADVTPTVFFAYQESSLGEKSAEVVHEAVLMFRESRHARMLVTGSCDTAEMEGDCPSLARRRADAVKALLVSYGVDETSIETRASMDLLVPTGPGARESRNRRVVIDFSESPK